MSGFASVGSFVLGTDLSLSITNNQTGGIVLLDGRLTNFTQKCDDAPIKSEPTDNGGLAEFRVVWNGWSGTIEVDRAAGDFDALFAFMEANYFAGGDQSFFS